MSSDDVAIRVENLSKCYQIYGQPQDRLRQSIMPRLQRLAGRVPSQYYRDFWAVKDISFEIRKGETVGIIGRNGSGKSTLLQILAGTLAPTNGKVNIEGRVAALLELGSGFNPEFTGRENVFLNGQILGLTQKEIEARYDQIAEFADIGEFINQPVKTYSSGMFVRLAFAVQAHIDASVVIIDEALAVGDVFFRQKCYARLEKLRSSGAAILLVSHAMTEIEQYCKRAILLDHGVQKFIGPSSEAAKHYYLLHQPAIRVENKPTTEMAIPEASSYGVTSIERPPQEAFIDLSNKSQVSNGQARCVGLALCNAAGQPCNSFRQGDLAVFNYEFELVDDIDVPVCGIVISNDRGLIVFGKNSWQYENVSPPIGKAGMRVGCRQEVVLDLGVGEYVVEVGLAGVAKQNWDRRQFISHDETTSVFRRICHMNSATSFAVGLAQRDGIPVLTHHGVANLPGSIELDVQ